MPWRIELESISKSYNRHLLFSALNVKIDSESPLAILGGNGSGKSTLLKIISGAAMPSEGKVQFFQEGSAIAEEEKYRHISITAPYMELIEEFSVMEMLRFYTSLKKLKDGMSSGDLLESIWLSDSADKEVRLLSSGMKQRLKLALAIYADAPILLLDEPMSNLDERGRAWYSAEMQALGSSKLVVVCSNSVEDEYSMCKQSLDLSKSG
jgi:ABC-type multidrug transport system ATPase subunit